MLAKIKTDKSKLTYDILISSISNLGLSDFEIKPPKDKTNNEVYEVRKGDTIYFLKFYSDETRDPESGMNEVSAIKLLYDRGFPVPEILAFVKSSPRNYILLNQVHGQEISPKDEKECQRGLEMLKEVKKVFTPRYGYIYANPEIYPKGNNYGEFINDVLYIAREKLLNKYDLSIPNNEILDGGLFSNDLGNYNFCHDDSHPRHLLLSDNKVTGILDLEWSIYAHPAIDFASWMIALIEQRGHPISLENGLDCLLDVCGSKEKASFYLARRFILSACWPDPSLQRDAIRKDFVQRAKEVLNAKTKYELLDIITLENSRIKNEHFNNSK